jgi:hypothetical protein
VINGLGRGYGGFTPSLRAAASLVSMRKTLATNRTKNTSFTTASRLRVLVVKEKAPPKVRFGFIPTNA